MKLSLGESTIHDMTLPSQSELIQKGLLPYRGPGKPYECNDTEVESTFLFSDRRFVLWQAFKLWRKECQSTFGDCRFLVNGSFVTSKKEPHDIDVAFLVNKANFENSDPQSILQLTTQPRMLDRKYRVQPFGGMLDAFAVACKDVTNVTFDDPALKSWDELWSAVNKSKHYLNTDETNKGYLEVKQ